MGNYANTTDITQKIPRGLDTTTTPSTDDIDEWIDDIENEFDLELALSGYATPIIGDNSIRKMKQLVVKWVVAETEKAIARGNNETQIVMDNRQDAAWEQLDDIKEQGQRGVQKLSDATYSAPDSSESFHSDHSDANVKNREPFTGMTNGTTGNIPTADDY